jgi:hypothetical protein
MKHTFIKEKIESKYVPSVGDFFVLVTDYEDLNDSYHVIFLLTENNTAVVVSRNNSCEVVVSPPTRYLVGNVFTLDDLQYKNLHFFKVEILDIEARVLRNP